MRNELPEADVLTVPDLVFNEMRFLQKPTDHQDEPPEAEGPRKSNAKDRKHSQGEEISAYFNRKKSTSHGHDRGMDRQPKQSENADEDRPSRSHPKEARRKSPRVDLPEKPFLGFGSKGGKPESKEALDDETAYYTWSDSLPRRSTPPRARPPVAPTREIGQLPTKRLRIHHPESEDDHGVIHAVDDIRKHRQHHESERNGQWVQTRRTSGPALVEIYHPPDGLRRRKPENTSGTKTTLQSLPKHIGSDFSENRYSPDNGAQRHGESASYHTSDILKIHNPHLSSPRAAAFQQQYSLHATHDGKENQDLQSSFSIDKALRHAQEAVVKPMLVPKTHTQPESAARKDFNKIAIRPLPSVRPERIPANDTMQHRYNDLEHVPHIKHVTYRPRGLTSSHQPATRQETKTRSGVATNFAEALRLRHVDTQQPFITNREDEEMLDNNTDVELLPYADNYVYANSRQAEELVHRTRSTSRSGIFEAQADHLEDEGPFEMPVEAHGLDRTSTERGLFAPDEFYSERSVGAHSTTVDDGLAGFWKPNKLY